MLANILNPSLKPLKEKLTENSMAVKMRLSPLTRTMDCLKEQQIAQYVFFSNGKILCGYEDGKNVAFSVLKEVQGDDEFPDVRTTRIMLHRLASSMDQRTSCLNFSKLFQNIVRMKLNLLGGIAFLPLFSDRMKCIHAINHCVMTRGFWQQTRLDNFIDYSNARIRMAWVISNSAGACVGLLRRGNWPATTPLEPVLANMYLVNNWLFIPKTPINSLGMYAFDSHVVGNIDNAAALWTDLLITHSMPEPVIWECIRQILSIGHNGMVENGTVEQITPYFKCDIDAALVIITRYVSDSTNVVVNLNKTISAWRGLVETIYEWGVTPSGNGIELKEESTINHAEDDSFSQTDTPRIMSAAILLSRRLDQIILQVQMQTVDSTTTLHPLGFPAYIHTPLGAAQHAQPPSPQAAPHVHPRRPHAVPAAGRAGGAQGAGDVLRPGPAV
jgi:hypothetical protein